MISAHPYMVEIYSRVAPQNDGLDQVFFQKKYFTFNSMMR
jgi:hypothetical protein